MLGICLIAFVSVTILAGAGAGIGLGVQKSKERKEVKEKLHSCLYKK